MENKNKYPILLVHGVALKEGSIVKAFGRIGKILREAGYDVRTADTDGFGTIEGNAAQLKAQIEALAAEGAEKVNLIAHSKGGIDAKYMILRLGMGGSVASLTTLSTPHRGSELASGIYRWPRFFKRFLAFWINFWYRLFGDKHPDALTVCRQLCLSPNEELDSLGTLPEEIFCQSYSSRMKRSRDDFLMSIPLYFSRRWGADVTDGMVSVESSKYAEYRGDCLDGAYSHSEIVGYSLKKKKRREIYDFYLSLCDDLAARGF